MVVNFFFGSMPDNNISALFVAHMIDTRQPQESEEDTLCWLLLCTASKCDDCKLGCHSVVLFFLKFSGSILASPKKSRAPNYVPVGVSIIYNFIPLLLPVACSYSMVSWRTMLSKERRRVFIVTGLVAYEI